MAIADTKRDKLHFIGIAGHAMRGVALAAKKLGYEVTGTDEGAKPPGSDWLDEQGITWWRQPDAKHLAGVSKVVISGGTPTDYLEITSAQDASIPIVSFAEFVGELATAKRRIVVAGTHGKTTTTSLIAWLMESAGRQPDFLVGIRPLNFDSSVRLTDSPLMILEGDEYSSSQLDRRPKFDYYRPDALVLTSIEHDHPDVYPDLASVEAVFNQLATRMLEDGKIYYWAGSAAAKKVTGNVMAAVQSYGIGIGGWQAQDIIYNESGFRLTVCHGSQTIGEMAASLFGEHNVLNVLAAAAVCLDEGLSIEQIQAGLSSFKGAARRFQPVTRTSAPVMVIDDYAHHPTEARAVISAARRHFDGRVLAVYRPHTFSRTAALLDEYRQAFGEADITWITDIEGAREEGQTASVTGADIAEGAVGQVLYQPNRSKLIDEVADAARPGDIILCMTVSGYEDLAEEIARRLA